MGYHGKYGKYAVIIFLIILAVFIYFFHSTGRKINTETQYFMDTAVTIKIVGNSETDEAINDTFKVMKEWAGKLDRFNNSSIISRINTGGQWVLVDPEISDLLQEIKEFSTLSSGAFDPTIAPLLDLWGFGQEEQHLPDKACIRKVLSRIDYNKLEVDSLHHRVFLPSNMALDLGGVAKGFIVDKGIEYLKSLGIESAYINAGGNIRVIGNKAVGQPWRIGIRKPRKENEVYQDFTLGLTKGSLATSGDYERYFTVNGRRYSHLLDPRTGYPAREMQSATIYANTGFEADLLSTAVFVLGWEKGKKLIKSLSGVEGFLVREDERWYSDGFSKLRVGAD